MSKIIFLDVDGTLCNYEGSIPKTAIQAIQQARKNGHRVYICTGRSKAEVYSEIWAIGIDGMIGGNGSYVEDNNQIIMHQQLSATDSRKIVDWLHAHKLEFFLESNNGLFASANFEKRGKITMQQYAKGKGFADVNNITVRTSFPEMIFGAELYRTDLNKISFILNDYQDFLAAKAAFPSLKVGTWGGKNEDPLFGDIGVPNISKAHAIDVLLNHLHASKSATFAFGDAKIDIPMLNYCHIGVAMGNSGPECKQAADYITTSVDENGIARAFSHFKLI